MNVGHSYGTVYMGSPQSSSSSQAGSASNHPGGRWSYRETLDENNWHSQIQLTLNSTIPISPPLFRFLSFFISYFLIWMFPFHIVLSSHTYSTLTSTSYSFTHFWLSLRAVYAARCEHTYEQQQLNRGHRQPSTTEKKRQWWQPIFLFLFQPRSAYGEYGPRHNCNWC